MKKLLILLLAFISMSLPASTQNTEATFTFKTSSIVESLSLGFQSTEPSIDSHTSDLSGLTIDGSLKTANFHPWIHYTGMSANLTAKLKGSILSNTGNTLPYSVKASGCTWFSVSDSPQECPITLGDKTGIQLFWTDEIWIELTDLTNIVAGTYTGTLTLELTAN